MLSGRRESERAHITQLWSVDKVFYVDPVDALACNPETTITQFDSENSMWTTIALIYDNCVYFSSGTMEAVWDEYALYSSNERVIENVVIQ